MRSVCCGQRLWSFLIITRILVAPCVTILYSTDSNIQNGTPLSCPIPILPRVSRLLGPTNSHHIGIILVQLHFVRISLRLCTFRAHWRWRDWRKKHGSTNPIAGLQELFQNCSPEIFHPLLIWWECFAKYQWCFWRYDLAIAIFLYPNSRPPSSIRFIQNHCVV